MAKRSRRSLWDRRRDRTRHFRCIPSCSTMRCRRWPPRWSEQATTGPFLPVSVERAVVVKRPGRQSHGHVLVRAETTSARDSVSADVFLRDLDGNVEVAVLTVCACGVPSVHALQRGASAQTLSSLYGVRWQEQPHAAAASASSALPPVADLAAEVERRSAEVRAHQGLRIYDEALPQLEALSAAYVLEALARLGWTPTPATRSLPTVWRNDSA